MPSQGQSGGTPPRSNSTAPGSQPGKAERGSTSVMPPSPTLPCSASPDHRGCPSMGGWGHGDWTNPILDAHSWAGPRSGKRQLHFLKPQQSGPGGMCQVSTPAAWEITRLTKLGWGMRGAALEPSQEGQVRGPYQALPQPRGKNHSGRCPFPPQPPPCQGPLPHIRALLVGDGLRDQAEGHRGALLTLLVQARANAKSTQMPPLQQRPSDWCSQAWHIPSSLTAPGRGQRSMAAGAPNGPPSGRM